MGPSQGKTWKKSGSGGGDHGSKGPGARVRLVCLKNGGQCGCHTVRKQKSEMGKGRGLSRGARPMEEIWVSSEHPGKPL